MKSIIRLSMVGLVVATTTACAHGYAGYGRGRGGWPAPPARLAPVASLADAVGRWDNVMMLAPGARIHVLRIDGTQAEGEVASASMTSLKLTVASGVVEISAGDVARVDRSSASDTSRRALSGAAHGVGAVGLAGLLFGRVPPARLFAAGAAAGADAAVHGAASGSLTIYLSPRLRR